MNLAAHPRSRGENYLPTKKRQPPQGSSPLTRGKTASASITSRPAPAHPRSRGENADASPISRRATGSSPLTRGKQKPSLQPMCQVRLIPAHAGKTLRRA